MLGGKTTQIHLFSPKITHRDFSNLDRGDISSPLEIFCFSKQREVSLSWPISVSKFCGTEGRLAADDRAIQQSYDTLKKWPGWEGSRVLKAAVAQWRGMLPLPVGPHIPLPLSKHR